MMKKNKTLRFPEIEIRGFKGVLLDIDDTIYNYQIPHQFALKKLIFEVRKEIKIPYEKIEEKYFISRSKINNRLVGTGASHSRFLYIQIMLEELLGKTQITRTILYEKLYWDAFLANMSIDRNAQKFINQCSIFNIPICCLTDLTAKIQFRKIKKLKLEDKLQFMVTSEEAGAEKPDKKMFNLALEKLKLKSNEVIMIGDNFKKDIVGAEKMGIKSYRVIYE